MQVCLFIKHTEGFKVWEDKHVEDDIDDCTAHFIDKTSQNSDSSNILTIWLCHFLARLQKKHYVPDAVIELLLRFLVGFFSVIGKLSSQLFTIISVYSIYNATACVPTN